MNINGTVKDCADLFHLPTSLGASSPKPPPTPDIFKESELQIVKLNRTDHSSVTGAFSFFLIFLIRAVTPWQTVNRTEWYLGQPGRQEVRESSQGGISGGWFEMLFQKQQQHINLLFCTHTQVLRHEAVMSWQRLIVRQKEVIVRAAYPFQSSDNDVLILSMRNKLQQFM